jgi:hypothetical protein
MRQRFVLVPRWVCQTVAFVTPFMLGTLLWLCGQTVRVKATQEQQGQQLREEITQTRSRLDLLQHLLNDTK